MNLCPELRRLSSEHARWVAATRRRAKEGEAAHASRLLALWESEILPHCRGEEDVLLPELTRQVSEADALVVFTLGDHVVLRRLVRELREAGEAARGAAAERLVRRLEEHVAFEERTLFPALQDTLGCTRLAALAREIARSQPADGQQAPAAAAARQEDGS
jgi:iron-sulfur cluster repair protein YtfE (RIC family)